MLPGNLTSSQTKSHPSHARTAKEAARVANSSFSPSSCHSLLRTFTFVNRALIFGSRISPVLFNACLKLIKAFPVLPRRMKLPDRSAIRATSLNGEQPHYPPLARSRPSQPPLLSEDCAAIPRNGEKQTKEGEESNGRIVFKFRCDVNCSVGPGQLSFKLPAPAYESRPSRVNRYSGYSVVEARRTKYGRAKFDLFTLQTKRGIGVSPCTRNFCRQKNRRDEKTT